MPTTARLRAIGGLRESLQMRLKNARRGMALGGLLVGLVGMGLGRVELPTSRLSGVRSNHLSYRPQ
jgi:hypothetical protein